MTESEAERQPDAEPPPPRRHLLRWSFRVLALTATCAWLALAVWLGDRRLPPGVEISGDWSAVQAEDVLFLRNLTAADAHGEPLVDRQIDPEMLRMIAAAHELLVLDTGLFGDLPAAGPGAAELRTAPLLSAQLAEALLRARQAHPQLAVLVLTDPASLAIDGSDSLMDRLRAGGIEVLAVDVGQLRAPNPAFASLWNLCCGWWNHDTIDGNWPNPLGVGPATVSFGLWGELSGYQRSHRQVLIADDGAGGLAALAYSRPLHAEADLHSASALRLAGAALEPLLESEFVLAQLSGWRDGGAMQGRAQRLLGEQRRTALQRKAGPSPARARIVTEAAIAAALVERIDAAGAGAHIAIAALYLSERRLVRALLDAARRGALVRLMLDPGKDGYGFERSGLPNRVVASELVAQSEGTIRVRWYRTHGEQFSPGFALIQDATQDWLLVGTAELTAYDLDDRNLSAAFIAELPSGAGAGAAALAWFDMLWFNRAGGGTEYTSDVDVYADASQLRYWQYRLFESTGTSYE